MPYPGSLERRKGSRSSPKKALLDDRLCFVLGQEKPRRAFSERQVTYHTVDLQARVVERHPAVLTHLTLNPPPGAMLVDIVTLVKTTKMADRRRCRVELSHHGLLTSVLNIAICIAPKGTASLTIGEIGVIGKSRSKRGRSSLPICVLARHWTPHEADQSLQRRPQSSACTI
jgi:hypothetical protein